jgi:hypothetical protein
MADLCDHVAAVLHPLPGRGEVSPPDAYDDVLDHVAALREETAAGLRAAWEAADDDPGEADLPDPDEHDGEDGGGAEATVPWTAADPVLSTIAGLRAQQRAADAAIRRLLAYAREFNRPAPYRLADLATAAEMSISGVRTAYTDRDVAAVSRSVRIQPRTTSAAH